jgi:hypothetical protein
VSYDPWTDLSSRPHIELELATLEHGDGFWYGGLSVILMSNTLTVAEQRCVLTHELAHIDNGDVLPPVGDLGMGVAHRQEHAAVVLTAHRLVKQQDLDEVRYAPIESAATHLRVTVQVLLDRMRFDANSDATMHTAMRDTMR